MNNKTFRLIKEDNRENIYTQWGKIWTHGADVMATFKKHGFAPPSEVRNDYLFKINREQGK